MKSVLIFTLIFLFVSNSPAQTTKIPGVELGELVAMVEKAIGKPLNCIGHVMKPSFRWFCYHKIDDQYYLLEYYATKLVLIKKSNERLLKNCCWNREAAYSQIKPGMSYESVIALIGDSLEVAEYGRSSNTIESKTEHRYIASKGSFYVLYHKGEVISISAIPHHIKNNRKRRLNFVECDVDHIQMPIICGTNIHEKYYKWITYERLDRTDRQLVHLHHSAGRS